jgi:hypothetical protein
MNNFFTALSNEDLETLIRVKLICGIISLIACSFIIMVYVIMFKKYRCGRPFVRSSTDSLIYSDDSEIQKSYERSRTLINIRRKALDVKMGIGNDLICFLILTNIGFAITTTINNFKEEDSKNYPCQLQAFLINFFDISSVNWSACIARITYVSIYNSPKQSFKKNLLTYSIYAFIVPLLISLGYIYII